MEYRIDKRSGNKLSALGFGCMRFPRNMGSIDMVKTEELILHAAENGINYFDTAYMYPGSEEALGKILAKNNMREKVYIATKLPLIMVKNHDFDKFFDKQLQRLKTGYIDYYLMHMLTDTSLWEKLVKWGIEDWLKARKESGQIKRIGFSFHGSRDEFLKLLDVYDWDFCQIQYNYLNENYQAGVTGLKKAYEKEIPVIIMEPLLGGKLASGLPKAAEKLFKDAGPDISPAAWALKWIWDQPEPTVVLSGMSDMDALTENLKTVDGAMPGALGESGRKLIKKVEGLINDSYKIKCTGCGYCMPCPKNVNIPACFHAYNTSYAMGRFQGIQQYIMSIGGTAGASAAVSLCVKCGACEKHCPQGIKIRDELGTVKKRMEPLWFRIIMGIAGGRKRKTSKNYQKKD